MPRNRLSQRALVILAILIAGIAAAWTLELTPGDLWPTEDSWRICKRVLWGAVTPALDYEAEFVPSGAPPIILPYANRGSRLQTCQGSLTLSKS